MTTLPPGWRAGAVALLVGMMVGMLGACQAQGPLPPVPVPVPVPVPMSPASGLAAEAALVQRIEAEVGTARCDSDAQCRSLPMGAKACGGPAFWLAWSTAGSRADALDGWSRELSQRQQQRQQASGVVSTCSVVADPGALCQRGRCVLGSSHPASAR